MKRCHRIAFASALILSVVLTGPALLAQQDAAEGWTSLFRGDSLDGWLFFFANNSTENNGTFTLKDGILTCTGKPVGYMYSKKCYRNFTLHLQWAFKRPEGLTDDAKFRGNNGYLIHIGEKNALGVWPRSIEVQGAHNQAGLILPIPRSVKCKRTFDKEALDRVLKPVGQWNTMEIEVNGGQMVISVNGTVVSTVSDCELTEGAIGFQSEGSEIRWRDVRIREK